MRLFAFANVLGIVLLIHNSATKTNVERFWDYVDVLKDCAKENGISIESYAYASKKNNTDGIYEKSKCVEACMFKSHKITCRAILMKRISQMRPDGTIDMEKAIEHLLTGNPGEKRDLMKKNIESCEIPNGDNECEVAHTMVKCALGYD
ncbi:uncharacterized protein LOC100116477 isoform X2 [Nasonia vitripennis]|uniref:Uncharacterized protein n=1 Tax=Nasonia vitripennis TaxID=7425 RepID=A0A7M7J8F3_NASVI|nr:uncharacterized protein LOC100116477 isoform X2 [Nasonia vitripennis]